MSVLNGRRKTTSVFVAKDRLKVLLVSDRAECTPDIIDMLKNDLYLAVSKYIQIDKENLQININRKEIYIQLTGENL